MTWNVAVDDFLSGIMAQNRAYRLKTAAPPRKTFHAVSRPKK